MYFGQCLAEWFFCMWHPMGFLISLLSGADQVGLGQKVQWSFAHMSHASMHLCVISLCVLHGLPHSMVVSGWQDFLCRDWFLRKEADLPVLWRPLPKSLRMSIIFTAFCWSKQVTRPAQTPKGGDLDPTSGYAGWHVHTMMAGVIGGQIWSLSTITFMCPLAKRNSDIFTITYHLQIQRKLSVKSTKCAWGICENSGTASSAQCENEVEKQWWNMGSLNFGGWQLKSPFGLLSGTCP